MSKESKTYKGLAVIYDPHNLYQFLWYYCNQGKEKEWDALCLPNGYKGEYMHSYCEKAGIFQKIYRDDTDYSALSGIKKLRTFLKMMVYFVVGKRTEYCKKTLNQFVNEDEYAEFVVIASVGVVSGACVALGRERNVIILEDGITDYRNRPALVSMKRIVSLYMWQGLILSFMGYCCPGWFRLKTEKECIKYCSHPTLMKYRNYRQLRKLYDEEGTDKDLFENTIRKIYPELLHCNIKEQEVLILTSPYNSFLRDYEKYKNRVEEYIKTCNYKTILLKKHPREEDSYQFGSETRITEINNGIPAEVLFPFFRNKEIVITSLSSSIIGMNSYNIRCTVLFPEGMYEESIKSDSMAKPYSVEEIKDICDEFLNNDYRIVRI